VSRDHRVLAGVVAAVLLVWLVGAAVTKYDLEQMAYLAPVAVVVVGATIGIVLLWAKIVLQAVRARREAGR
jgi:hypothetical protein